MGFSTTAAAAWFQSLLGFLIRCNASRGAGEHLLHRVSIPIGFSNPLQRWDLQRRV